MTIGDVAVNWEDKIIYVGTGEVNSSRSSYAGNGVYRSNNNGESWDYLGLADSHHIGRIIIDKSNKQRIIVAVLGHLYSPNEERGFFLSEDGGDSWTKTLYVNENCGGIDLVQHPTNPSILYGATWQRERRAWNFIEAGEGSGIYKSTNGGRDWVLISTPNSRFPQGEGVGRIGLDISTMNGETYLYAILDNYERRPKESDEKEDTKLTKDSFKKMTAQAFNALDKKEVESFLKNNGFPKKYNYEKVKSMIDNKDITPTALYDYLQNANALLFETSVIGAELYLSKDNGETFSKTYDGYIEGLFNSYGYYFSQVRTEPKDPSVVYIMGVPILRSRDFGKSWKNINGENVHVDHHALWINPQNPNHIINGNDGGVNISYDKGDHWIKCNTPTVGQFYAINVDYAKPYNVYAGAQDNGVWTGSNLYSENVRWHQSGQYPYKSLMGGDGMQIQIDNRDNNTVYTGFQFGNYFRINKRNGSRTYITPKHKLGDGPYRWNWQTPILLSAHNQDILYMGANKLLRSMDKGENFVEISTDLTNGGIKGDVAYGTIVSLDESRENFGKIIIGTDDGNVHLTSNGGSSWDKIDSGLPKHMWVSRAIISRANDHRLYVSLNGYRWDDFNAYLYTSNDDGKNWDRIGTDLPAEPINVIKEDPSNENILYVGTDHGLYVSTDMGKKFQLMVDSMPKVAVHDLAIQEEAEHLLVGTHGRSIYQIDISYLRAQVKSQKQLQLFSVSDYRYQDNWGSRYSIYSKVRKPNINLTLYSDVNTTASMKVKMDKLIAVSYTHLTLPTIYPV